MGHTVAILLLLSVVCCSLVAHVADAARPAQVGLSSGSIEGRKPPKKFRFKSPKDLFIQERASKQLPGPGQHFSFGALVPWDRIHDYLDTNPNAKLLLLVRHGQAISNWLSDTLGPDDWFNVEGKCTYTDANDTTYQVFDAELTDMGASEARSLNGMLDNSGWFQKLTAGRRTTAVVSPLSRCLQTAELIMDGLRIDDVEVEENIRETLGEDTCDARRSVSSPDPEFPDKLEGPCCFEEGLRRAFPKFRFPIVNETARQELRGTAELRKKKHKGDKAAGLGFGLISDKDIMWTEDREGQKHQVKRAVNFLMDVFDLIDDRVVVVVTHSGTVRSLLLAVGREPYRPQNTELVPVLVEEIRNADDDVPDDVPEELY